MANKNAGLFSLFIVGFFTSILSLLATYGFESALLSFSSIGLSWQAVFLALFIYDLAVCWAYLLILGRLRIFESEKPMAKALRLWLPSLAFLILGVVVAQAAYSGAIDSCRQGCEGSYMCEAHCPGTTYLGVLLFMLVAASVAGPCNPVTLLIACHIRERLKNLQPTSL